MHLFRRLAMLRMATLRSTRLRMLPLHPLRLQMCYLLRIRQTTWLPWRLMNLLQWLRST